MYKATIAHSIQRLGYGLRLRNHGSIPSRSNRLLFSTVQTSPGVHRACPPRDTRRSFSGVKVVGGVMLTTHFNQLLRLGLCGVIPPLPYIIAWVLGCSNSTFGWKWDNVHFWFSVVCCTTMTQLHRLACVWCHNVFCSELHLNCRWIPDFKPSFLKIGVDEHSILPLLRRYVLVMLRLLKQRDNFTISEQRFFYNLSTLLSKANWTCI
jgi:hypothetical protein